MKGSGAVRGVLALVFAWLRMRVVRRRVTRLKAQQYDELAANVQGLRRALETSERALQDAHAQIAACEAQIARMREEYGVLERRLATAHDELVRDAHLELFNRLRPVVTQLATVRAAMEGGAEVSGRDVLALLGPLDEVLRDLGFEAIGAPGAEVPFDPRIHHLLAGCEVEAGIPVQVRTVGYTHHGSVVCKAQVVPVGEQ